MENVKTHTKFWCGNFMESGRLTQRQKNNFRIGCKDLFG
jgi:hypothetical protein